MEVTTLRTAGIGDATYVVAHDGLGVVVDPQRDIGRFERVLAEQELELRWVLETHVHNDYVSGGRDLAARLGADLVLPAGSGAAFTFLPAFHQEDLPSERGLTVRPLHTPGHTPEHVSYVVLVDGRPVAVFSGGSLLVGSSGRPDLLGQERAEPLARLQYLSVNRLAALPDDTALYPTHGQGSFCTVSDTGRATSTIGEEKRSNPVLAQPDADAFATFALQDLQPYPAYYRHMAPINLHGPTALEKVSVPDLGPEEAAARGDDVWVIDARPPRDYAAGHIPGSVAIGMEEQFGVWAGWVLPWASPVLVVLESGSDEAAAEETAVQLGRIGFTDVRGVLRGLDEWAAQDRPLESAGRADPADLAARLDAGQAVQVLDVRSPAEVADEPLEGALAVYVPELAEAVPSELDRDRPVWVVCASGYRSAIAASLLARADFETVIVDGGGVSEVNAARAQPSRIA